MAPHKTDVEYCPGCGRTLSDGASFVQEFWVASETVHFCWCAACSWRGEIKSVIRMIAIEPAEDDDADADPDSLRQLHELETLYNQS